MPKKLDDQLPRPTKLPDNITSNPAWQKIWAKLLQPSKSEREAAKVDDRKPAA